MIISGKMTQAGLDKIEEAKRYGLWDIAYTSKVKERIPSDLKKALLADRKAWDNFQRFENSYRNMYCGWVKAVKRTRQEKEGLLRL